MKKIISLTLALSMAAGTASFAFAEEQTSAEKKAAKIVAGTVRLSADTTLNGRNSATQAEKTAAVAEYAKAFLYGDSNGAAATATAKAAYKNGAYTITVTDSDGNTAEKTINESEFDFVYTVKSIEDEFTYVNATENLDSDSTNDVTMTFFADLLDGTFARKVTGNYDLNIAYAAKECQPDAIALSGDLLSLRAYQGIYAGYISSAKTTYYNSDIGENYIFETNYRVEDRMTPENEGNYYPSQTRLTTLGTDYWSAMMTVKNRKYEMSFTPENDGLYYKTVDSDGNALWQRIDGTGDTYMHSYKAIVNGKNAVLYIDGVKTAQWVMPETTGRDIRFSTSIGALKDGSYDLVETKLDFWRLYNVYENQVFIETFENFDNLFMEPEGYSVKTNFSPDPNSTNNYRLSGGFDMNSDFSGDKYLYYKLPKNTRIKSFKIYGQRSAPAVLTLRRFGYGYGYTELLKYGVVQQSRVYSSDAYGNQGAVRIYEMTDAGKAELIDNNKNIFDILGIAYSSNFKNIYGQNIDHTYFNGLSGVEIEYEYFYDDLLGDTTELVFADNMTDVENDDTVVMDGYKDWSFSEDGLTTNGKGMWKYNGANYIKMYAHGGIAFTPHVSDTASAYALLEKNNFADIGEDYIFRGKIYLDKAYAVGTDFNKTDVGGNVDIMVDIATGGKEMIFAPHWNGEKYQLVYYGKTGYQTVDLPSDVVITDKAFNDYKVVSREGTATLYINGVLGLSWELPDTGWTRVFFRSDGNIQAAAAKAALRDIVLVKGKEPAESEIIDGISGIADVTELGDDLMISFGTNKISKAFTAYLAKYTGGKLSSVESIDVPKDGTYDDEFIISKNATGYKLFFWDSAMAPVYDALSK